MTTSRNLLKEYDDNTEKNGGEPDTEYLVHCAEAYRPVRKEVGAGAIDTASKAPENNQ